VDFKVSNITFDCNDVMRVAEFWSIVLGRPMDNGSSEVFASIGGSDVARSEPAWYFNKVADSKISKNRVHLDLMNPDATAVDDLVSLGATVVSTTDWGFHGWTVMNDPEGNEFCVAAKTYEDTARP
jgi:hypothetical protein